MRLLPTIAVSLIACGPLAPPLESTTAASSDTDDTTESAPVPTTAAPEPITTTTLDQTTLDLPTTASTTTEEHPFIIKPDGDNVGRIECDVFNQDCDPGQKCAAWAQGGGGAWNATKCVDIMGDGAPGEPCTTIGGGVSGVDTCGLGVMCWDVNAENEGICVGLCTGSPNNPMCPLGTGCALASEGVLNLCLPDCNPLLQDCPGDDLCVPDDGEFICALDASGDMGAVNDPCESANTCDKGLACRPPDEASSSCDPEAPGCCQPFCELPDAPCPNPDQVCVPWYDPMMEVPPFYENVGICAIPE
jgi:hypothetical protein